jgi:hypothetical protein
MCVHDKRGNRGTAQKVGTMSDSKERAMTIKETKKRKSIFKSLLKKS